MCLHAWPFFRILPQSQTSSTSFVSALLTNLTRRVLSYLGMYCLATIRRRALYAGRAFFPALKSSSLALLLFFILRFLALFSNSVLAVAKASWLDSLKRRDVIDDKVRMVETLTRGIVECNRRPRLQIKMVDACRCESARDL